MLWLGWIVLGGLAGWVASMVVREPGSAPKYIAMGVLGSIVGGLVSSPMRDGMNLPGLQTYGFIAVLLGSLIFIWLTRMAKDQS